MRSSTDEQPGPRTAEACGPAHALRDRTLLLVEDDAQIRGILARWAAWVGVRLDAAVSGAEGLALARVHDYVAILLDIRMPEMDGPTFYEHLERARPELARRVIAVTGDDSSAAARSFLARTGCRHLLKPFDLDALSALIVDVSGAAGAPVEPPVSGPRQG